MRAMTVSFLIPMSRLRSDPLHCVLSLFPHIPFPQTRFPAPGSLRKSYKSLDLYSSMRFRVLNGEDIKTRGQFRDVRDQRNARQRLQSEIAKAASS